VPYSIPLLVDIISGTNFTYSTPDIEGVTTNGLSLKQICEALQCDFNTVSSDKHLFKQYRTLNLSAAFYPPLNKGLSSVTRSMGLPSQV